MKMRIWTTFHLILGVLIEIQVQCFQEGICRQKAPPRGVQVLAPGTEVTLHCSGRISVNGVDIAQTGGASTGRTEGDVREGPGKEGVHARPDGGVETIRANRSELMEEPDLAGGAGDTVNLTMEERGGVGTGLNGSEVGGAVQNANASGSDGAYAGAPGTEGREARVQWRVNGRLGTRGEEEGGTLRLAPLRLSHKGNYSCHRGGRKVFSVEIVVAAPLEQPTLSCYRRTPTSKIRCDWTANQSVTPTPQCSLIMKMGLYGELTEEQCSFSPSRARCWCVLERRDVEKSAFQATLCLTSVTGNVTSPTIQVHPKNIIKPDPPANVTVHAQDGMEHRLKVTWKYPRTWSSAFYRLKFHLQYFPIQNGEANEMQDVHTKRGHHTINDVLSRTAYLLRVRAKEEFDLGQWSDWSPPVYARSWTAPEPSASSEVHVGSETNPLDPFMTGSGDWSENELPPGELVSPSILRPTLTFHLSWVLAACVLVTFIGLAVYILRHRKQLISKLHKLVRSSASHTPAPAPSQLPKEEGSPLVSPGPSAPPLQHKEDRGEGIHLNNMGYFLVQTN
ncbi:interleukin-6 receptor subunit alpha isoform X1 [Anguilla anguilla]|uniref:interleukin-6 receptor subunit alpha isoform X1 n=1 Tax=Anguilla anguilla TaxID=7936 RepID=UPI0015B1878A|nr:interleukin-6 receptor subunit alpha isoform X1 [Anguilla anguilla]